LETRDQERPEFTRLIDDIYKVPHETIDTIKQKLARYNSDEKDIKVMHVLERIRDIGENAQSARPDNMRLRGARITADSAPSIAELDGRCKWLVGTLHLMVRKMKDAGEDLHDLQRTVDGILQEVKDLVSCVDEEHGYEHQAQLYAVGAPSQALAHPAYGASVSQGLHPSSPSVVANIYPWAVERVETLFRRAKEYAIHGDEFDDSQEEVQKVLEDVVDICKYVSEDQFREEKKRKSLLKCRTLWEMKDFLSRERDELLRMFDDEADEDD